MLEKAAMQTTNGACKIPFLEMCLRVIQVHAPFFGQLLHQYLKAASVALGESVYVVGGNEDVGQRVPLVFEAPSLASHEFGGLLSQRLPISGNGFGLSESGLNTVRYTLGQRYRSDSACPFINILEKMSMDGGLPLQVVAGSVELNSTLQNFLASIGSQLVFKIPELAGVCKSELVPENA